MYTEIEKDEEGEVRYNQISVPLASLDQYIKWGWQLVREEGTLAVIRKELKA
jgi:hypothetical protein